MTGDEGDLYARFRKARYFPSLDGLRAISIIAVVWHHAAGSHGQTGILARGMHGVSLFFAISGFLITTLLLREKEQTGSVSLKGFYIRRTLRIFPLYYAVLALYVALVVVVEKGSPAGQQFMQNLPAFVTYTSNWFVDLTGDRVIFYFAWSLATEEQFYLVWPWVVRYGKPWQVPVAFMSLLLVARLATYAGVAAGAMDERVLGTRMLESISVPIVLGSLCAYAAHYRASYRVLGAVAAQPWSVPLGFVLVAVALGLDGTPVLLDFVAMTYLVVACCVRPDTPAGVVLASRPVRWIGTVSYGMYLLHMFAVNAARKIVHQQSGVLVFLVAVPLAVLAASVSYKLFESPFLRLKDRLAHRPSAPATPSS